MKTTAFWAAVGGRKQFNGYIYAALITAMFLHVGGSFETYCMSLGAALLGTSFLVAHEERLVKEDTP